MRMQPANQLVFFSLARYLVEEGHDKIPFEQIIDKEHLLYWEFYQTLYELFSFQRMNMSSSIPMNIVKINHQSFKN